MNLTAIANEIAFHAVDAEIQHQRVLQLARDVTAALARSNRVDAVSAALERLIGFLELHCADEEQFMTAHAYPAALRELHASEHVAILARLRASCAAVAVEGTAAALPIEDIVTEWVRTHSETADEPYLEYFRHREDG